MATEKKTETTAAAKVVKKVTGHLDDAYDAIGDMDYATVEEKLQEARSALRGHRRSVSVDPSVLRALLVLGKHAARAMRSADPTDAALGARE